MSEIGFRSVGSFHRLFGGFPQGNGRLQLVSDSRRLEDAPFDLLDRRLGGDAPPVGLLIEGRHDLSQTKTDRVPAQLADPPFQGREFPFPVLPPGFCCGFFHLSGLQRQDVMLERRDVDAERALYPSRLGVPLPIAAEVPGKLHFESQGINEVPLSIVDLALRYAKVAGHPCDGHEDNGAVAWLPIHLARVADEIDQMIKLNPREAKDVPAVLEKTNEGIPN